MPYDEVCWAGQPGGNVRPRRPGVDNLALLKLTARQDCRKGETPQLTGWKVRWKLDAARTSNNNPLS